MPDWNPAYFEHESSLMMTSETDDSDSFLWIFNERGELAWSGFEAGYGMPFAESVIQGNNGTAHEYNDRMLYVRFSRAF